MLVTGIALGGLALQCHVPDYASSRMHALIVHLKWYARSHARDHTPIRHKRHDVSLADTFGRITEHNKLA